MPRKYATGTWAWGICDRCGLRYRLHDLRNEFENGKPTGLKTCRHCWDDDHPQNDFRFLRFNDPEGLRYPQPETYLADARRLFAFDPIGQQTTSTIKTRIGRLTVTTNDAVIPSPTPDVTATLSRIRLVASANTLSAVVDGAGDVTNILTGETATMAEGTLTISTDQNLTLTGLTLTSASGTMSISTDQVITLTGQTATLADGTVIASAAGDETVVLTGSTFTVADGTLGVTTDQNLTITGSTMTATEGTVTMVGDVTPVLTGQTATIADGTLGVATDQNLTLTGQTFTATEGDVTVDVAVSITLTGETMTATEGDVTITTDQNLTITGATMTATEGDLVITTDQNLTITGTTMTAAEGDLAVSTTVTVALTGQTATVTEGDLGVSTTVTVALTGETATASEGTVTATGTGGAVFSPLDLFDGTSDGSAGTEDGFWLDAQDIDTLWTDDGTTQVSSDGDLVYRWDDKSGNSNHVYQTTSGERPEYDTGVDANGGLITSDASNTEMTFDDDMLGMTGSTNRSIFVITGAMSNTGYLFALDENGNSGSSFRLRIDSDSTNNEIQAEIGGSSAVMNFTSDYTSARAAYGVILNGTTLADLTFYANSQINSDTPTDTIDTDTAGSNRIMGARTDHCDTQFYEVIAINRALTSTELDDLMAYFNDKYSDLSLTGW